MVVTSRCFVFRRANHASTNLKNFSSSKLKLYSIYATLRLVRISLLIIVLNKGVLLFSGESYFIKAIENVFPAFAYPGINTRGVWRILDSYAKLSRIVPTPLVYANTENVCYCLIVVYVKTVTRGRSFECNFLVEL